MKNKCICIALMGRGTFDADPDSDGISYDKPPYTAWYLIDPSKSLENNNTTNPTPLRPFSIMTPHITTRKFSCVSLGSKIYQIGGIGIADDEHWDIPGIVDSRFFDTQDIIDNDYSTCSDKDWHLTSPMNSTRTGPAAVVNSGQIFVFGTTNIRDDMEVSYSEVYEPDKDKWSPLAGSPMGVYYEEYYYDGIVAAWSSLPGNQGVLIFPDCSKTYHRYNFAAKQWTSRRLHFAFDDGPRNYGIVTQMPLVDGFMYHCDSRGLFAVDLTSYLDNESDSNSNSNSGSDSDSGDESDEFYDRSVPVSGLEKVFRKYTHIDMEDPILVHLEDNRFSIIFHPYARPTEPAKLPCLTFSIERSGSAFTAKEEHFNFYLVTEYEFEALNAFTIDTVVDADRFLEVCTSGDALSKDDHSGGYANEERARCRGSEKHAKERECIVPPADYVVEYVCGDPTVEGDVINDQVEKDVISKSEVSGKERSGFMLDQQHQGLWSVLTAVCLVAAVSIGFSRAR